MSRVPSEEVHLEKKRQGEGCEIGEEEEPKRQKVEDEDEDMDEEQVEKMRQGEGCEIAEEEEEPNPQKLDDFNLGDSDDDDGYDCESEVVGSGIDNYKNNILYDVQGYMCDKERLCRIDQHDCTFGSPLLEIFKVKLIHNGKNNSKGVLGHLYGEIVIPRTSANPNRYTCYYRVKKEDRIPITLSPGKHIILPLSGPDAGRPPLTLFPRCVKANFTFNFDGKDLGQDSCSHDGIHTSEIRGYVCSDEYLSGVNPMCHCWICRDLIQYSPSDPIKVAAYYGLYLGAWATVNVEMVKKGVSCFYGLIFARSCLFRSRFRLLSIPSDQKRVIKTSESLHLVPIELTRKVVSVPSYSSLIIGAVLYDQDGNQIVKDKTIFPAKEGGPAEAFIGETIIKIKVEWGSEPALSDWKFCNA